jgi:hypothetical protein
MGVYVGTSGDINCRTSNAFTVFHDVLTSRDVFHGNLVIRRYVIYGDKRAGHTVMTQILNGRSSADSFNRHRDVIAVLNDQRVHAFSSPSLIHLAGSPVIHFIRIFELFHIYEFHHSFTIPREILLCVTGLMTVNGMISSVNGSYSHRTTS